MRPTAVSGLRILVVEDDAVIAMLLAETLVGLGYEVCDVVSTEAEAVTAAARERPDLMVVDVQLAWGDGASAMRTILQNHALPHVFMTGGHQYRAPAGAVVLQKPFGESELIRALASVLEASRLSSDALERTEPAGSLTDPVAKLGTACNSACDLGDGDERVGPAPPGRRGAARGTA